MKHWRLCLFVMLIVGALVAFRSTGLSNIVSLEGLTSLRESLIGWGWKGAVVYFLVYTTVVTFGLPNLPFQLAAGAIYGLWPAYALMYLGVNLGALTAFFLARILGRSGIEELWGHHIGRLNARIEKGGFRYILTLRLIPLLPFNAINYASGLSRLSLRTYILANAIGMLPLTFLHVLAGSAAMSVPKLLGL